MKVKLTKKEVYPLLGIYPSGQIVLFLGQKEGVCLDPGSTSNSIGEYCTSWLTNYRIFEGEVVLSNE